MSLLVQAQEFGNLTSDVMKIYKASRAGGAGPVVDYQEATQVLDILENVSEVNNQCPEAPTESAETATIGLSRKEVETFNEFMGNKRLFYEGRILNLTGIECIKRNGGEPTKGKSIFVMGNNHFALSPGSVIDNLNIIRNEFRKLYEAGYEICLTNSTKENWKSIFAGSYSYIVYMGHGERGLLSTYNQIDNPDSPRKMDVPMDFSIEPGAFDVNKDIKAMFLVACYAGLSDWGRAAPGAKIFCSKDPVPADIEPSKGLPIFRTVQSCEQKDLPGVYNICDFFYYSPKPKGFNKDLENIIQSEEKIKKEDSVKKKSLNVDQQKSGKD